MNIYHPVFSTAQTAEAAGMTHSNFRAHLARGNWVIGSASKKADVLGKGHLFSIYDVLGYALAKRLMDLGVDPKFAFERAMLDFAHVGGTTYKDGSEILRAPGGVFPLEHGVTIFSYVQGAERGKCYATKLIGDPIMLLYMNNGGFGKGAVIVPLNLLRIEVFAALGLEARDYE